MTLNLRPPALAEGSTTECDDGTICENSSPCVPHPLKEGSYMCDCAAAQGSSPAFATYAGVYCEHPATSYCQKGSASSGHGSLQSFCTNGGECRFSAGKDRSHAGCKCPGGYEGSYCQFVEGSVPSDWSLDSFMHPQLVRAYATQDESALFGVFVGILAGAVGLCLLAFCHYLDASLLRERLRRREKEMDTNPSPGLETPGAMLVGRHSSWASSKNEDFAGGNSHRKTSTPRFVDENTLDADGGVFKEAMGETVDGDEGADDLGLGGGASMEEVDLDDMPGTMLGGKGEMA